MPPPSGGQNATSPASSQRRVAERGWIKRSHRLKRREEACRGLARRACPRCNKKGGQQLRRVLIHSNTPLPPIPVRRRTCPYARPPARMHHILICAHMEEVHPEALHRAASSSFPPLIFFSSSPPPSRQRPHSSVASAALIPPLPSLPPPSALAMLVLGGGHGHASLSGLINHPHSWQPASPPGANGSVFFFSFPLPAAAENMNFQ